MGFSIQDRCNKGGNRDGEQDADAAAESLKQFYDDKLSVQQLQKRSLVGYEQQYRG